jgi:hypothetical protein
MPTLRSSTFGGNGPHPLLDGTINDDTLAAAPLRGSLIVGNSTPKWSRLTLGANGTVLTSNGTDASWQTSGSSSSVTTRVYNAQIFW